MGGSQKAYLYCRKWARENGYTFYVKPCRRSATANGRRVLESDECPKECEWDAENELCECEDGDVQAGHVYEEFGRSQCVTSWTPYAGDRKDNPVFGGGGFDMVGTALACKTKCDHPDTKDSRGRRCVAVEHSSQDPNAVANCAFAWDCESTAHWSGGKVYRRSAHRRSLEGRLLDEMNGEQ